MVTSPESTRAKWAWPRWSLGAGRQRKEDKIDHSVGVVLGPKVGARVRAGETLLTIHARNTTDADQAARRLLDAYTWSDAPVTAPPLVYDILRSG